MPNDTDDFAALLARARRGEAGAIADLVRQYEPEVRRVAHARLRGPMRSLLDSMDLVNSVHRCILLGLRQNKFDLAQPANLVALAVTMVRRKIARQWRRLHCQQHVLGKPVDPVVLEQRLLALARPRTDPAAEAELRERIQALLPTLEETDRRLLELRLQGFRTADAARVLGLNADVLRVRLSKLRRRLRASGLFEAWL